MDEVCLEVFDERLPSMLTNRAFTLLEVLISIMLLSLVLMALYRSADILRASNRNLFHYLENSSNTLKGIKTLYMDIIKSDGNLTLTHFKKFHSIEIENTKNSLYGLYHAKVVWLVYKTDNILLRIEGNRYHIPLKNEENVAIDVIAKNMELFKIYTNKKNNKILIISKVINQNPQSFIINNLQMEITKGRTNEIHIQIIGGVGSDRNKNKKIDKSNMLK